MHKVLLLFSFIGVCYNSVEIGKYLKICKRNSVDLNDCMVDAVRKGIATMIEGIDELGTPPLDPFYQKDLKVEYNANQISAKMEIKNIYVLGLKDAIVHDARVRAEDDILHIEVDLTADKVYSMGEYQGQGQYNALKIQAYGDFNVTMSDLKFTWKLDGTTEKNASKTYIRINSFYMRPDVGSMMTYLTNNNAETKELTTFATGFANQNWRLLYREFLPFAQANWNKIGMKIANKIFLQVPYDDIFPIE